MIQRFWDAAFNPISWTVYICRIAYIVALHQIEQHPRVLEFFEGR